MNRVSMINAITEEITAIEDCNLPLLQEAAVLLTGTLPPWTERSTYEEKLITLLRASKESSKDEFEMKDVNDGYITGEFYDPTME